MKVSSKQAKIGTVVKLIVPGAAPARRDYYGADMYLKEDEVGVITANYAGRQTIEVIRKGNIVPVNGREGSSYEIITGDDANTHMQARRDAVTKKYEKNGARDISPGSGISMGSDPEVFVVNSKDVVTPAWEFLPKKKPGRVAFWDGVQAEFTTTPNACHAYVMDSIRHGLNDVYRAAKKHNKKAELTYKCVVDVPEKVLAEASDEHAGLGCAPSLNVYPDIVPLVVEDPRKLLIRFAGCHIHFGYGKTGPKGAGKIVRALDAMWGVMSVALFRGMEDPRRRQYYGRAGEYRLPPHGLEYRVPSSAALAHPALTHLCFDFARIAGHMGRRDQGHLWNADEVEVRQVIDTLDVEGAEKILKRNKDLLHHMLASIYGNNGTGTRHRKAWRLIHEGAVNLVDVNDMKGIWGLSVDGYGDWSAHSEKKDCQIAHLTLHKQDNEDAPAQAARA